MVGLVREFLCLGRTDQCPALDLTCDNYTYGLAMIKSNGVRIELT